MSEIAGAVAEPQVAEARPKRYPPRVLVRGVNWLGDAVMTTPALMRIREYWPKAHIVLLTHEKIAGLWQSHPAINEVMTFGAEDSLWKTAGRIRAGKFNLALALPNSTRTALELFFAWVPRRYGYANGVRSWLLTHPVEHRPGIAQMHKRTPEEVKRLLASGGEPRQKIPPSAHHVHHYLHLAGALGASVELMAPHIGVKDDELAAVTQKFDLREAAGRPLLGLNAGAEYGPAKRWPRERFVAVAKEVQRRTNCRWVIFGGKADVELATGIAGEIAADTVNLAGRTSLRELCVALKACRVVLTNDTGPMHVAAAVVTPVVVPFGSTSPEFTGPGMPGDTRHQLIKSGAVCSPCFLRECPIDFRCMLGIEVERVVEAVVTAMRK